MSPTARERLIEQALDAGTLSVDDVRRAERRRDEYRAFGVDVPAADLLAEEGRLSPDALADAARGEDIPSRIAGLDVLRLAGGTAEHPLFLARRALDGETFLVHACMLSRSDAPADVDEFVRACERGKRLTGPCWLPVRESVLADGAYAAVTAVPDGMRLDEWLETRGTFPADKAVALLKRLGEALWPLEALNVAASFPEPSLVHVTPDGSPWLLSMEILLSAKGRSGDLPEVARSAARLLARLVGPERVTDPAVSDLLSDLSSGRFEGLRPDRARGLSVDAATAATPHPADTSRALADAADALRTPVGLRPPPTDAWGRRHPAPTPTRPAAPQEHRFPWRVFLAIAAVLVIAITVAVSKGFLSKGGGEEPRTKASPEVAEGPGPGANPARPPEREPARPTGSTAPAKEPGLVALEDALAFLEAHHADDPKGAIDKFRKVELTYGGTGAAAKAAERRAEFEREVEAEAERKASTLTGDVERYLSADELGAAYAAIGQFPRTLLFTKAAVKVEALRGRVKEKAESAYTGLRPQIDAGALPGKQDAAKAAFERVRALGDPDLTARAEQRLKEALERATGSMQRRKALEADLQKCVGETLAAAGAGDFDRARRVMDAAARGPLADVFPDRLSSLREAVDRVSRAFTIAVQAAKARVGKTISIAPREYGAKALPVTVVEAMGDRLTYSRGGMKTTVPLGTLDAESVAALVLSEGREADAAAVHAIATLYAASGQKALAEATLSKATALGAPAGEFAAEEAAVEAWLGLAARREVAAADAILERDREGARAGYARAAATAPFLPDPHRKLGEMLAADKKPEEALKEFERAKALGGGTVDVLHAIAKASATRGDLEALEAWRAFLAAAPPSDPRLESARAEAERLATKVVRGSTLEKVRAAKSLLDAGKAADAVTALEEAVSADPALLEARKVLARAAEKAGDPLKAWLSWRAARDLAKASKDVTEAKEQMDRLDRAHGERPAEAMVRKTAEESKNRGEYATAADMYRRAVAMSPLDPEARLGLAESLYGLAARTNSKAVLEECVAAFDAMVSLAPEDPRGLQGRGELRLYRGDVDGAVLDATASIQRKKDSPYAYNTRARALYQSLQFDAALADMTVVVTLMPLYAMPRISRAQIYTAMGRYEEASADLKAALDRNPSPAERAAITAWEQQIAALKKAAGRR